MVTLLDEIRNCQDILSKITDMKLGYLGTALVTITNQVWHHTPALLFTLVYVWKMFFSSLECSCVQNCMSAYCFVGSQTTVHYSTTSKFWNSEAVEFCRLQAAMPHTYLLMQTFISCSILSPQNCCPSDIDTLVPQMMTVQQTTTTADLLITLIVCAQCSLWCTQVLV